MTSLKQKIQKIIAVNGPITVNDYMTLALTDPQFGYYQTQIPFGHNGDFITAPEISQLFGEMIGIWVVANWKEQGCPQPFILAEIGPGRGTLMNDVLRTMRKICVTAFNAAKIFLVEISQHLAQEQKKLLGPHQKQIYNVKNFEQIPLDPLILIANELFDALPIHQYIKINGEWRERHIALDTNGNFTFTISARSISPSNFLMDSPKIPDGNIWEYSPARNKLMKQISNHLMKAGGSALLIDYGSAERAFGDTLQAISKHKFSDVFSAPGKHDLTSHVDFFFLKKIASQQGCFSMVLEQRDFLLKMGILERAKKLSYNKDIRIQNKIQQDIERLTSPDQMGRLFKVLCVSDKNIPLFSFLDYHQ
ncbi:class I SAM-dependent methyltransferase [Bartonella ancashensis]|uniref:SAM-dependent methyltransferase, MidA n=1 Tax=Bartonella ancashensis TaxID=1318743 RepID=A0A0M5KSK8_9HYPH|nr:class I SAM-dependent methyltransferase [Bartonella ancashensis]ALE03578.1 hypothetical protein PU02_0764 [Bartonella ancashensis]